MPAKKSSKMKVKGKRTLKNGAVAGYVYYSKEKKWKWRIIGKNKKGGGRGKGNKKYTCSSHKTNKLEEMCVVNSKGKYNTLEECVFSNECLEKQRSMPNHRNLLTNRSYPMDQLKMIEYERKLKDRINISNNNSSKNSTDLNDILKRLLKDDNLLVLSERHLKTPIEFLGELLDILVEMKFNYFLCETGKPQLRENATNQYSTYYNTIKKLCESKGINFVNIETDETWRYSSDEKRTSELVNGVWANFAVNILRKNRESKIIYFIGSDHAGFGSERFQTVPYVLSNPITIKLQNTGNKELLFNKPTHSCYNYLTLNY